MEGTRLWTAPRSAVIRLADGGYYETRRPYRLTLNGKPAGEARRVITSLAGLTPGSSYALEAWDGPTLLAQVDFSTPGEGPTLDVYRFGAAGDGVADDTAALQAAIACCPPGGRVLVPPGRYLTAPLFLKSHLRLELMAGATLALHPDKARSPILPGLAGAYNLGAWEGNPLPCYAALLTGVGVEDVAVYGQGTLDGQGVHWWGEGKAPPVAFRGRLVFLNRCRGVTFQGLTLENSPSWHIHPYYSRDLAFYDLTIRAPAQSPNTDGLNPESCENVKLWGLSFAVGDDCVAVKAGKPYMAAHDPAPCQHIEIAHCRMADGHGGVTIGSEMSGSVRDVRVHHCQMLRTDRGLRIKTRRGRGGAVEDILLEDVCMEGVAAPCTVNCFYFCDPDGHQPYAQDRSPWPVDGGTPRVGGIALRRVAAHGCAACAGYFLGLPEAPIRGVTLEDADFTFDDDAAPFPPVMADGVGPCRGLGIAYRHVEGLTCRRVAGAAATPLEE